MRSWLDGQAFSQEVGECQRMSTLLSFKLKPILHYALFWLALGQKMQGHFKCLAYE